MVLALEEKTAVQTVVGSIVWAFRRLKKPRSREMSARGYALHSVCSQLSFFSWSGKWSSAGSWLHRAEVSATSTATKICFKHRYKSSSYLRWEEVHTEEKCIPRRAREDISRHSSALSTQQSRHTTTGTVWHEAADRINNISPARPYVRSSPG